MLYMVCDKTKQPDDVEILNKSAKSGSKFVHIQRCFSFLDQDEKDLLHFAF